MSIKSQKFRDTRTGEIVTQVPISEIQYFEEVKSFRSATLTCGCCGEYFHTWPDYIDQDQDKGYGICAECQDMAETMNNDQLDKIAGKIREALNETNTAKFDTFDIEKKRRVAMWAVDEGIVTFGFGGAA